MSGDARSTALCGRRSGSSRMNASIGERYREATEFLKSLDEDWARAIDLIGPCTHEPKAGRAPYEATIRAVAYQTLTARAGHALLGRRPALYHATAFPASTD